MDQYSLLHFATGVLAYFWGMPLWTYALLHIVFELTENTTQGIHFINEYIPIWPGGKPAPDSPLNQIGDIVFGVFGWASSILLDKYMFKI